MRYRFLFLLLLLSLSACTFQVDVLTPEPSVSLDGTAAQPATLPLVETFTPTPLPPPTELNVPPTFTSTALPQIAGIYPIKFSPNGTYMDVVDTILTGKSKTYSINALKGQIMSISVHQNDVGNWTVVPIRILGADGTTLCPQQENRECYFWRGALPSSQDYFVTLTPVIDIVDFTMRVDINQPGTTTQSFQYMSNDQNASFVYTDDFAPVRFPEIYLYKFKPEMALQFIDTKFHTDTNLVEAYFMFGASNDTEIVVGCLQPSPWIENEQITGEVTINGTRFIRSERIGVGLGSLYEQSMVRTVQNDTCYEVTFLMHSFDPGVLAPPTTVTEFDRAALMQRFETILSTLLIK